MPTVKNAVFAAATTIACTTLPTPVEAVPARPLAFLKPNPPDATSKRELLAIAPVTTYTLKQADGETRVFWRNSSAVKVEGALSLARDVTIRTKACRPPVYSAASPATVGEAALAASLIASAAIARTLG